MLAAAALAIRTSSEIERRIVDTHCTNLQKPFLDLIVPSSAKSKIQITDTSNFSVFLIKGYFSTKFVICQRYGTTPFVLYCSSHSTRTSVSAELLATLEE